MNGRSELTGIGDKENTSEKFTASQPEEKWRGGMELGPQLVGAWTGKCLE